MFRPSEQDLAYQESTRRRIEGFGGLAVSKEYALGNGSNARDVWRHQAELFEVVIPEAGGGIGSGLDPVVLPLSVLGANLVPGPYAETLQALRWIGDYGSLHASKWWYESILRDASRITMSSLDPASPSSPGGLRLSGDPEAASVSGDLPFVPYATDSEYVIALAHGRAEEGLTPVLIALDSPGVVLDPQPTMDASRPVATVSLRDVALGRHAVLVGGPGADQPPSRAIHALLAATAALELGALEEVTRMAAKHAVDRVQFGQPIGRFQGIKHRIADMKVGLEASRSLVYDAAEQASPGHSWSRAAAASRAAKAYVSDALVAATSANIQIHGAMGYTAEFDAHLFLKRARAWSTVGGSPAWHREQTLRAIDWAAYA